MYEIGLSKSFVSWHVMPDMEGPEGELHSHDYRIDVVVTRDDLDDRGMVCDLDVLQEALDKLVAIVEGQDLEIIRPPDADAVTVEVFARWAHDGLVDALRTEGHISVRIWESPLAFGGYSAPARSS